MTVRAVTMIILACGAITLAACGGGSKKSDPNAGLPVLGGTAIPTTSPVPPTEAVCAPAQPIDLPASFPKDVPVPDGYTVFRVTTSPYLHVVGRLTPTASRSNPPKGIVADAIVRSLVTHNWSTHLNIHEDGQDYDFTNPDGRVGHFLSAPVAGCTGQVELTYDLKWVTG